MTACASGNGDENGSDSDSASTENFRILAVLGTSGLAAQPAASMLAGVNAAVDTINDAGGISGRNVEVKVMDTQSDPSRAVSMLTEELASNRPDLLFTGSSSAESVAVLPLATRSELPFVNGNQASDLGNPEVAPFTFSTVAVPEAQGEFMAETLADEGYDKIGLLVPNSAVGEASEAAYAVAFEDAGLEFAVERFEAEDIDMSAPISRLNDQDVDAVVFWSAGQASAYILSSRELVGLTDLPFYGDAAVSTSDIGSVITAGQAENVWINTYSVALGGDESEWLPGKQILVEHLREANVDFVTSLLGYALAYDAIIGAANAFEELGGSSDDAAAWQQAMQGEPAQTFPSAMDTSFGFTAESHFRADFGGYTLVQAGTPLVNGLYQVTE